LPGHPVGLGTPRRQVTPRSRIMDASNGGPLRRRFERLAKGLGLAAGKFDELNACYGQPERHYHGWRHVAECLARFDAVRHLLADPRAVELALWYHDAVCRPGFQGNELQSAEMAYQALLPVDQPMALKVRAFIRATDYGKPPELEDPDLDFLRDIDFAAFGKPYAEFREDLVRLQREMRLAADPQAGTEHQIAFYEAILSGEFEIFRTAEFATQFRDRARDNVRRALAVLKAEADVRAS